MKRVLVLVGICFVLGVTVSAKDFKLTACSKDNHPITTTVTVDDTVSSAHPELATGIQKVFLTTARSMTAVDFVTEKGYQAFASALTDVQRAVIEGLVRPTVGTGKCSVAPAVKK